MSASSKHGPDIILLFTIIGLTLFGLMMIGSASSVIAERFRSDVYYYLKHQLVFGLTVGLVTFLVGYFIPYKQWRIIALPALIVSLVLLVLVFIPGLRVQYGDAARWIRLGPITLQPTEITKFSFILYLAALLERKGEEVRNFRKSVVPFLVITGIICVLIVLQPDIGTLFTIIAIAGAMVFVAGFRLHHLIYVLLGGLALFGILINTAQYRLSRIMVYLHPELDPQGIGYQINQALLAVGTGGLWGLGFGRSRQKYQYLPEPAGDAIFAIISEELGLIRTLILLAAFLLIGYRGFRIARKAPDTFGRLLAAGITAWILLQAFVNMASILAITPLTGIPLPFVSYGGTALVTVLLASGVLLNISKYSSEAS
jgi:cell division protein FtsW